MNERPINNVNLSSTYLEPQAPAPSLVLLASGVPTTTTTTTTAGIGTLRLAPNLNTVPSSSAEPTPPPIAKSQRSGRVVIILLAHLYSNQMAWHFSLSLSAFPPPAAPLVHLPSSIQFPCGRHASPPDNRNTGRAPRILMPTNGPVDVSLVCPAAASVGESENKK